LRDCGKATHAPSRLTLSSPNSEISNNAGALIRFDFIDRRQCFNDQFNADAHGAGSKPSATPERKLRKNSQSENKMKALEHTIAATVAFVALSGIIIAMIPIF